MAAEATTGGGAPVRLELRRAVTSKGGTTAAAILARTLTGTVGADAVSLTGGGSEILTSQFTVANGGSVHAVPSSIVANIAEHVSIEKQIGVAIFSLDLKGFAVSSGAACSSGAVEPSHVLLAIGLSREQARSCLRLSIGAGTTAADIESFLAVLPGVVERLRALAPAER